ncbi:MAG: hypothetical protein LBC63_10275 [Holophagales bacterium]|jgi:hypothetical protein|nr:hypothetical protein [Holophagales bacterium]
MEESSSSIFALAGSSTPTTIVGDRSMPRNGESRRPTLHVVDCSVHENEPNEKTLEAMAEIERSIKDPSSGKRYTDVKAMMAELLANARD